MAPNESLTNFLKFYLKKTKLRRAILINGEWGSGKTFFIKGFMEKWKKDTASEIVYITLNGVSTDAEIDEQIFRQLNPILGHKITALFGRAIKGGASFAVKTFPGTPEGSGEAIGAVLSSLGDGLKALAAKSDTAILIFDDIERCKMPIDHTLGLINQFVEHEGHSVIVLGYEKEIAPTDAGIDKKYREIKEKLFGWTFDIEDNVSEALQAFIDESEDDDAREILLQQESRILELYLQSGYRNLRSLKQAVDEFGAFYSLLPPKARAKKDLVQHALSCLIVLSLEIRKGKLRSDSIVGLGERSMKEISDGVWKKVKDAEKEERPRELGSIESKYTDFDFHTLCPNEICWQAFFQKGCIPEDLMKESIDSSRYFLDEQTPDWKKLWYFDQLEDEDFEITLGAVKDQFERLAFSKAGVVCHIGGILLQFAQKKMISASIAETKDRIIAVTNQLFDAGKIDADPIGHYGAYDGLGFQCYETPEFKEFYDHFQNLQQKSKAKTLPALAEGLLDSLKRDPSEFLNRISLSSKSENRLYDVPILAYVNPKEFATAFIATPNKEKHSIGYAIRDRYKHAQFNASLAPEIDWLKTLKKELIASRGHETGKVTGLHIDTFTAEIQRALDGLTS